uniref:C-type lectin domain-containing protein n=1 Tax=Pelusios castaneus TaxID=367368 RepID=A0A8C8S768_9SAUR
AAQMKFYKREMSWLQDIAGKLEASPQGSGCKLCPPNWLLHGDKCYWLSKESKTWKESHDYCAAKNSQMPMFQDQDEKEFIKNITEGKYPVWIGFHLTTSMGNSTWVDGSQLEKPGTLIILDVPVANSFWCGALGNFHSSLHIPKCYFQSEPQKK